MKVLRKAAGILAASALATLALPGLGQAADKWPSRTVEVITPYPAGGSSDATTRLVADSLSKLTDESFVVINKAGAGGTLGVSYALHQKPDGYTILVTPMATVTLAPWLRNLDYSLEDLIPVAKVSSSYGLITTNNDTTSSNYKEFVAAAKKNPGKFKFGTNGVGSVVHLTAVSLHKMAGIDLLHIPYKGASSTIPDLLGGRIDIMYDPATTPLVAAGKLKGLAVTADIRNPEFPNISTLKEQGFNLPFTGSWFGVFVPKGTPDEIVEKLAGLLKNALSTPQAREVLLKMSMYPNYEGPKEFSNSVHQDSIAMRKIVKSEGLKVD